MTKSVSIIAATDLLTEELIDFRVNSSIPNFYSVINLLFDVMVNQVSAICNHMILKI